MKNYIRAILFVVIMTMFIPMCGCQSKPVDASKDLKIMDFKRISNPPPGIDIFKRNNPDYKITDDGKYNSDKSELLYDYIYKDDMDFDIIWVDDILLMSTIYNQNKFVDLSGFDSINQAISKAVPGYQQTAKYSGKVIGVPMMFYGTNYGLVYDKAKCSDLAVDINDLDTFDKIEMKVSELNDKVKDTVKLPIIDISTMTTILSQQYQAKYGDYFANKNIYNNENYKKYLELLKDWTKKGLAGDFGLKGMSPYNLSDGSLIKICALASVFAPSECDFARTPAISEKDPAGNSSCWYIINPKSTKIDACVKFLETIINEELRNYPLSDAYVSSATDIATKITPSQADAYKKIYTNVKATSDERSMVNNYDVEVKYYAENDTDSLVFNYLAKAFDEYSAKRLEFFNQFTDKVSGTTTG